jgi:hypothetical protein
MASYDYSGFVSTFTTPGRAGTAGQKIFSIHNGAADASPTVVSVSKVSVSMYATVIKAVTMAPPIVRLWKVTVAPTGGDLITKVVDNTDGEAADSLVVCRQDASANVTSSSGALTATLPAGTFIKSIPASRIITAVASDVPQLVTFDLGKPIKLRNVEGLVVFLDYTDAGSNPITDMWTVNCEFSHSLAAGVLL